MNYRLKILGAGLIFCGATALGGSADAYEFGYAGFAQAPGLVVGNAATAPPPGLYMFNQVFTYNPQIVGPGAPSVGGLRTNVNVDAEASGLVWVPGWHFLGADYDAVIAQPFLTSSVGNPIDVVQSGIHNTLIVPIELSWKLGNGFFAKAGFGAYVPDGTVSGPSGLGSVGAPWWTFQPNLVVSYLNGGWNLTANMFEEINTRNTMTGYTSGDVLHAEFTAVKTIGKWTIGPVAYYVGQVTDDKSSGFYGGAINVNRYNIWAAGGLVGYNFGPAQLNVWAFDEVAANASGGTAGGPGVDSAIITKGWSAFASLSFRLWAPDEPATTPTRPQFHK
jgi:hypothetical protein